MAKRDPEIAAYARRYKKEQEESDLRAFLDAYERGTGELLEIEAEGESPDFDCKRLDGTLVGVELTQVRRSPEDAHWDAVLDHQHEMDPEEAFDEIGRLISQKGELEFRTPRTILVLVICEADFRVATRMAMEIPNEDLHAAAFEEIWMADFKGIREGAHRTAAICGLYPEHLRVMIGRSDSDHKPYG